jgi:hypothetical protein
MANEEKKKRQMNKLTELQEGRICTFKSVSVHDVIR